jgi:hypothetical protein
MLEFQDLVEQQIFGVALSKEHCEMLLQKEMAYNALVERVRRDRQEVDYAG